MSASETKTPSRSIISTILLSIVASAAVLWGYHSYVLKPWDVLTVDFRRLSDAKLGQLAERAMAGQPTTVVELEEFIRDLQANIYDASRGRLVFTSGTILNSSAHDLTEDIARQMGLDLSKGLEASLPGLANRIGGTLTRNLDEAAPGQADQGEQVGR